MFFQQFTFRNVDGFNDNNFFAAFPEQAVIAVSIYDAAVLIHKFDFVVQRDFFAAEPGESSVFDFLSLIWMHNVPEVFALQIR